jgi:predicted nucleic acid-binding protein
VSVLADTSVLVEYLRGREPARELFRETLERGESIYGSVLTRVELSIGMRPQERRATDALVAALRWLPADEQIADAADELARAYSPAHSGIDAVDYCIAATARLHDLKLWTLNLRHFPMFEKLERPW